MAFDRQKNRKKVILRMKYRLRIYERIGHMEGIKRCKRWLETYGK